MYWADKVAKEIIESGKFKPYWVDDMKTPSGSSHIGSLRGPIVHDLIFKALRSAGQKASNTFVINDFDAIDELPPEIKQEFSKYLGFPLKLAPSPNPEKSLGDYYGDEFKEILNSLGIEAEYLSSYDMYKAGKFDEVIKQALDNSETIQDIYQEISGSKKREQNWLPFQAICENCGKIGTTRVFDWDGEKVSYKCEPSMVAWAQGCGHEGQISPFGGTGKLPWKVDWPAHWKVLGITVEGGGKDHSSAGGSRDIASALCKKVFSIPEPFNLPYEFLLIGGKKMSSSKGLGYKAKDIPELLPWEMARFLFCRTDYKQQANFNPVETMAIPDLFDEYDRCFLAFLNNSDEGLARTYELSHIGRLPEKQKIFLPRFRDVANFIQQPTVDIYKKFIEMKGSELSETEKNILEDRIKYAKIWIERFAPKEVKFSLTYEDLEINLTDDQKKYLLKVIDLINGPSNSEELQVKLYELSKEMKINAKLGFQAIYQCLIGKDFGPKAGALIRQYEKQEVIDKIQQAL